MKRSWVSMLRVIAVAAAVIGLIAAAGALVSKRLRTDAWRTAPTSGSARSLSTSSSPDPAVRLVAAPDIRVSISVRPTWLPPDLVKPRIFTDSDANMGMHTITYERAPSTEPGTESVAIATYTTNPLTDTIADADMPSWVTRWDTSTVDVNSHTATQFRSSSRSVGGRTCGVVWQHRTDLWINVNLVERTTDISLHCDSGLRVARGVLDQQQDLARTVRLTLVPAGYVLSATGTNREDWCNDGAQNGDCVYVQSGRGYSAAPGKPVTVHRHPGTIDRSGAGFLLNVPGWIRIWSNGGDLTDTEILQMAETAVLDGGW